MNPNELIAQSILRRPVAGSSNIVSAGYDYASKIMTVEFKSGFTYYYLNVLPDAEPENKKQAPNQPNWKDFSATFDDKGNSTGSYFAKNFRLWLPGYGKLKETK